MELGKVTIPTEVYLGFLGETITIHWDNHAYLMVFIWLVMVPLCVIAIWKKLLACKIATLHGHAPVD